MPFKSEKQRRFLWAKHPDIAKRWAHNYPESNKDLPMYAKKDQAEKDAALGALTSALMTTGVVQWANSLTSQNVMVNPSSIKSANDGLVKVDMPKTNGPVYAAQEQEAGQKPGPNPGPTTGASTGSNLGKPENTENKALDVKNPVAQKLAAILGPALRKVGGAQKAAFQAPHWARDMLAQQQGLGPAPQIPGAKRYAPAAPVTPLPMGMQGAAPAGQPAAPQPSATSAAPGGSAPGAPNMAAQSPSMNPIDNYGGMSKDPSNWGTPNAAFGMKNSPDSLKFAEDDHWSRGYSAGMDRVNAHYGGNLARGALSGTIVGLVHESLRHKTEEEEKQTALRKALRYLGAGAMGATVGTAVRGGFAAMTAPSSTESKSASESGAWTRAEGKSESGGLNAKGRASLKAQGHDIKAPVTESNPSGERAKRQNSFCSRMCGMKKVNTGADTKKDPDSRINKSLRKWNCKCGSAYEFGQLVREKSAVNPATLRKVTTALTGPVTQPPKWLRNNQMAAQGIHPTTGLKPGAVAPTPPAPLPRPASQAPGELAEAAVRRYGDLTRHVNPVPAVPSAPPRLSPRDNQASRGFDLLRASGLRPIE